MPSLISSTERALLTGIFNDIFDTFQRRIVVFKEPTKTSRTVNPNDAVFGFGEVQTEYGYDYTEVTGVYPAVIRYGDQQTDLNSDGNFRVPAGSVSIKVKKDCRDFINAGKTEKVEFDNRSFIIESEERKQSFLDSEFYLFILKPVK